MKSIHSIIALHRIISFLLLSAVSSLQLLSCQSKQNEPPKTETKPSVPLQLTVSITKIDGATLQSGQIPQVGRQVMVEGTISDPNVIVCVLVHPMTTDTWWVQNPPAPPGKVDERTWSWRTMVLCGTETLGLNEEFEIVALAEGKRAICQLGRQIKMEGFPQDLSRSEVITVRRIRN